MLMLNSVYELDRSMVANNFMMMASRLLMTTMSTEATMPSRVIPA
jgi:hypothetical protein